MAKLAVGQLRAPQGGREAKAVPLPLKMKPWESLWILLLALTLVESLLPHQL